MMHGGEGSSNTGAAATLESEARALLAGMGHLFLAHPEAGYERVVPLALDSLRGLQVQAYVSEEGGATGDNGGGGERGGGARWIAWTELKALAERRCVLEGYIAVEWMGV